MNQQEAFDKVWDWFVVQKNPPSVNQETGMCKFRGPKNTKCAVGVLIPDNLYHKEYEAYVISEIKGTETLKDLFSLLSLSFLSDLQTAHDVAAIPTGLKFTSKVTSELTELAATYNLKCPAI